MKNTEFYETISELHNLPSPEEIERQRQRANANPRFRYPMGRLRNFSVHAEDMGIGIKLYVMEVHAVLGISEPTVPLQIYRWGIDGENFDKKDIEELIYELFDKTQRPRRATFKMLIELQPKYYAKLLDMHPDNRLLLDEWLDATGDELDEYKFPVPIPTLDALHVYWRSTFAQADGIPSEEPTAAEDLDPAQDSEGAAEEISDEELTAREDAEIGNELAEEPQDAEDNLIDMRRMMPMDASELHKLYAFFTCDIHPEVETKHTSSAGWILEELVRLNYEDVEDFEESAGIQPLENEFMERLSDLLITVRHNVDKRVTIYVYRDESKGYETRRVRELSPMRYNDCDLFLLGMVVLSFEMTENFVGAYLTDVEVVRTDGAVETGYIPPTLTPEEIEAGGFIALSPLGEELEYFGYVKKKPLYLLNPSIFDEGHFVAAVDYGYAYAEGFDQMTQTSFKHCVKGALSIYPLLFIAADEEKFTLTANMNEVVHSGLHPSFAAIMDAVQIDYFHWHKARGFKDVAPSDFNGVRVYNVYDHLVKVKVRRVGNRADFATSDMNVFGAFRQMMLNKQTPVFQVLLPDVKGVFPDEEGYNDANGDDYQPVYGSYDRNEWD